MVGTTVFLPIHESTRNVVLIQFEHLIVFFLAHIVLSVPSGSGNRTSVYCALLSSTPQCAAHSFGHFHCTFTYNTLGERERECVLCAYGIDQYTQFSHIVSAYESICVCVDKTVNSLAHSQYSATVQSSGLFVGQPWCLCDDEWHSSILEYINPSRASDTFNFAQLWREFLFFGCCLEWNSQCTIFVFIYSLQMVGFACWMYLCMFGGDRVKAGTRCIVIVMQTPQRYDARMWWLSQSNAEYDDRLNSIECFRFSSPTVRQLRSRFRYFMPCAFRSCGQLFSSLPIKSCTIHMHVCHTI